MRKFYHPRADLPSDTFHPSPTWTPKISLRNPDPTGPKVTSLNRKGQPTTLMHLDLGLPKRTRFSKTALIPKPNPSPTISAYQESSKRIPKDSTGSLLPRRKIFSQAKIWISYTVKHSWRKTSTENFTKMSKTMSQLLAIRKLLYQYQSTGRSWITSYRPAEIYKF